MSILIGNSTLPDVATMLSVVLDRVVVDKTGVAGQFRFHPNFASENNAATRPTDAPASDVPSLPGCRNNSAFVSTRQKGTSMSW
jgi:uncharacterized protein (TIGR03435 family)